MKVSVNEARTIIAAIHPEPPLFAQYIPGRLPVLRDDLIQVSEMLSGVA